MIKAIVRYKNRKLYDKMDSHYITLKDIIAMVKTGQEFLVVSNETKKDITRQTLQEAMNQYVELDMDTIKSIINVTHPFEVTNG